MVDQCQCTWAAPSLPMLAPLFAHPDVREGVQNGCACFEEDLLWQKQHHSWSEKQIIAFVHGELSNTLYQQDCQRCQRMGLPREPYLHRLGFVIGYLNHVLALPQQAEQQRKEGDISHA